MDLHWERMLHMSINEQPRPAFPTRTNDTDAGSGASPRASGRSPVKPSVLVFVSEGHPAKMRRIITGQGEPYRLPSTENDQEISHGKKCCCEGKLCTTNRETSYFRISNITIPTPAQPKYEVQQHEHRADSKFLLRSTVLFRSIFYLSASANHTHPLAMAQRERHHLTDEQVAAFMEHGFIRLENCFSRAAAAEWTSQVWTRLGYDRNDKSTWAHERTNMPAHRTLKVSEFAPKAWDAICELSGGVERVTEKSDSWNDAFIVNLGGVEHEGEEFRPKELDGWHVDGDFFVHFLDSPEQGLLAIPLWTDVVANGGGTAICTEGVGEIARHLYNHPEGTGPGMIPTGQKDWESFPAGREIYRSIVRESDESNFHEMTGKVGDVILLHPLMLHSAAHNGMRMERIITNPPVSLKSPFRFDREDGKYSLVELKTLRELGKEKLENWEIVGQRQRLVPERERIQAKMKEDEKKRLAAITERDGNTHSDATHLPQIPNEIKLGA